MILANNDVAGLPAIKQIRKDNSDENIVAKFVNETTVYFACFVHEPELTAVETDVACSNSVSWVKFTWDLKANTLLRSTKATLPNPPDAYWMPLNTEVREIVLKNGSKLMQSTLQELFYTPAGTNQSVKLDLGPSGIAKAAFAIGF